MKRILLLEDDMMIASGLVYALTNEGYEVVHCKDVSSAIENVKKQRFQLVLILNVWETEKISKNMT